VSIDPAASTPVRTTTLDSPIGPLRLVARGDALVGLTMAGQRHERAVPAGADDSPAWFGDVAEELAGYFAGERRSFAVPVAPVGTPFQQRIWRELGAIPYGTTSTYAALAARVDRPSASRAVGQAVGRNPVAVIVPCHRVLASGGGLGGYAGGLDRKVVLLDLEARVMGTARRWATA
jgi:methylated-DNA-[protein]-cysteine S-methyltransferase